jgi:hypothetical protein
MIMKRWTVLILMTASSLMIQAQSLEQMQLPGSEWTGKTPGHMAESIGPRTLLASPPSAVAGLSGYHGSVPLAWSPVISDTLLGYDIYKSPSSGGPFTRLAGGISNCYFRDDAVSNGTLYYYKIKSVYQNSESGFSGLASGKAQENGYEIHSAYAGTAPTVDGIINSTEWAQAQIVDILFPGTAGVVRLYVENDQNRLYLAIDDQKNTRLDAWDAIGIFFDRDMDREWSGEAGAEGLVQIYWEAGSAKNRFAPFHGKWPNKLSTESASVLTGISQAISFTSGHVQTEIAVNLNIAPFNYLPFSMMGFLIYAFDGGNSQFTGLWPQETTVRLQALAQGYSWAHAPFAYGNLTLSQSAPSGFWADVDHDRDVDIIDIQLVAARWGNDRFDADYQDQYDVNADGNIDIFDIQLVASWWNQPIPPLNVSKESTVATDEPVRLKLRRKTPEVYELLVVNAADLAAFQVEFSSDEDVKLRQTVLGDFLGGTGNTVITLPPHYSSDNKKVIMGAFSYGVNPGASGPGKLAEIIFEKSTGAVVTDIKCADRRGNAVNVVMDEMDQSILAGESPQFRLAQNYPNPFNPFTTISFTLPNSELVSLTVFDLTGNEVVRTDYGGMSPGWHQVYFDGGNLPSGKYFYRLQAGSYSAVKSMMLVR